MKATLTFDVEVPSVQKATALRDKHAELLREDPDVTVINEAMAQRSRRYKVVGVDTSGKQPFSETVEAEDEEKAKALAIGKSQTKVVAEVTAQA